MKISVVGMGKIGLPLAVQYATKGHDVWGVDINPDVVTKINEGTEPFPGEKDLKSNLSKVVARRKLQATTDYSQAIPGSDVIVVVVPLFVDEDAKPDFGWMDSATESIAQNLTPGSLVVYETTLPVGTTRKRWKPLLESISGLVEGTDFHVAFSPERVLTGRVFEDLRRFPKVVGGLSDEGEQKAVLFYQSVLDFDQREDLGRPNGVWSMGSAEAAELVKLAETTYRDVNIGLANQFAIYAETQQIDVYKVIEACNSQPYSHIHQPGIAVGGHCIPVYPRLYLWNDPSASIVEAARSANRLMPGHAVSLLEKMLGTLKGVDVLVLGAAYRGGVKETAFSGVFDVVRELTNCGAIVTVADPLYSDDELRNLGFEPAGDGVEPEALVVQADHSEYRQLSAVDYPQVKAIVDGRGILDETRWGGVSIKRIGA